MAPAPQSRQRVQPRTLVRFAFVIGSTAVAFWNTWLELIEDVQQGSDIGYIFAIPVLCTLAAIGIALRRRPELPIYDRQTDIIVGLLGLAVTAALVGLLVLRYPYEHEVLHLDVPAVVLFALSVSILAFGLRPAMRFWPVWVLALVTAVPTLYREVVITLGGTTVADGAAMLVPAAVAAAIAAGRTRRRALAGAAGALAAGGIVLAALEFRFPDWPIIAFQLIPSIGGLYTATTIMYFYHRDWSTVRALDRPMLPFTAKPSRAAEWTIIVATALIAPIPNPTDYQTSPQRFVDLVVADAPAVAPGWQLLAERQYPWAPRYFGPKTTWVRQQWRAQRGNPQWDKESRRRRIMVDIVRSDSAHTIDRYPEFTLYRLDQPRVSPPVRIDLGHGVTARLNSVLDDRNLLSWTWLTWTWQGRDGVERISLISADNHLPDASFPQPEPSVRGNFVNLMHEILRGNAVNVDPESVLGDQDSEHKDQDMLTAVARALVAMGAGE
ncbi:hypothetical protein NS14008_23255 [Nocardia seriolae]|nr:hypothetical protein NS14008_23255 [Nocardia seriolae]